MPERVVLAPLPKLYVYDHCPFCVRARLALGAKNVKYDLVWLMNDDFDNPISLVGKKVVPIFVPPGGDPMAESLDIVSYVDNDTRFGPTGYIRPASGRTDIDTLLDSVADPMRRLTRVRFSRALLPEFTFQDARDTYVERHQLKEPPFSYDENWENSPQYIEAVQKILPELDELIFAKDMITEGGFSTNDITTFPKLRSLTIIKGLELTPKIKEYVEFQGARAEIPLYYNYAF